ncbi:alpha/beta fold hydrolase [Streptomyces chartreusis]|uniref:alpha/beta fold hydrolase n=1 Tax=Streptomyces chartreusis TaxID=1969 RepID=UPI00381C1F43
MHQLATLTGERMVTLVRRTMVCNEITLSYLERGALSAATPTLVFIHGYGRCAEDYGLVFPHIPESWHVIALDLRGHGQSERTGTGYEMQKLASDVESFFDAMGLSQAVLIGHSMGSLVARLVAISRPDLVKSLVLAASTSSFANHPALKQYEPVIAKLQDPIPEESMSRLVAGSLVNAPPPAFLEGVIQRCCSVPARIWRTSLSAMLAGGYSDQLDRLKVSTLVIWGEEDLFTRPEQDRLVSAVTDARLISYENTGHDVPVERPEWLARDILEFARGNFSVNERIMHEIIDMWNGADPSRLAEIIDPGYIDNVPMPGPGHGPERIAAQIAAVRENNPECRYSIDELVSSGNHMILRYTYHESRTQSMNTEGESTGIAWYQLRNGRVIRRFLYSEAFYASKWIAQPGS